MAPNNSAAPPLSFVPLAGDNLAAVAGIAATAPDPWGEAALRRALKDEHRLCRVALMDGQPVAFACFLVVAGSADLQQLATHPDYRRRGIAAALVRHALGLLPTLGALRCLLEVRAQNAPAITLYEHLGFKTLARRPGMYAHPPDDGLLMALAFADTPNPENPP